MQTDTLTTCRETLCSKTVQRRAMLVPVRDKLVVVRMDEVACIYSSNRITQIVTKDGRVFQYGKSLDTIAEEMDPMEFYRANKQYIVSKSAVKELLIWFDKRILIRLDVDIPEPMFVSKNKAADFKEWLTL